MFIYDILSKHHHHHHQVIIQEMDLKLEQQVVLASWDCFKDYLHERNLKEGIHMYIYI
jgi:hypothetical protein